MRTMHLLLPAALAAILLSPLLSAQQSGIIWKKGGHTLAVTAVGSVPGEGSIVTASYDSTLVFWDPVTGNPLRGVQGTVGPIHSLSVSRDGKRIAVGGTGGRVALLDAGTGSVLRRFPGDSSSQYPTDIVVVAFDSTGRRLVWGGEDGEIAVWDLAADTLIRRIGVSGPGLPGHGIDLHPDGTFLAVNDDDKGAVGLWNLETGLLERELPLGRRGNAPVAFSPQGDYLAAMPQYGGAVTFWNTATWETLGTVPLGTSSTPSVMTISGGGDTLALLLNDSLLLVDARSRRPLSSHSLSVLPEAYFRMRMSWRFLPDGRIAIGGGEMFSLWGYPQGGTLALFDPSAGAVQHHLFLLDAAVSRTAWTPVGDTVVVVDRGIVMMDSSGHLLRRVRAEGDEGRVDISSDGRYAIAVSGNSEAGLDEALYSFALGGGDRTTLRDHMGEIPIAYISPDGAYATESGTLYDLRGGARERVGNTGFGVVFSRDNRFLAGLDRAGSEVVIRALPSGGIVRTIDLDSPPNALDVSRDGELLAVAQQDGSVTVWDVVAGTMRHRLPGDTLAATAVTIPPDKSYLLGGYADGTIRLWRLPLDAPPHVYHDHQGEIRSMAVSPDGSRILSSAADRMLVLRRSHIPLASVHNRVSAASELEMRVLPNPATSSGTISFSVPRREYVSLAVYDAAGEKVASLREGVLEGGSQSAVWDLAGYPAGIYFCRLVAGGSSATGRIVLVR